MARKMGFRIWLPVALLVLLCACPTAPAGDTGTTAVKAIAALTYADFGFPSGSEAAVSTSFTVPLLKDGATFTWSSTSSYVSKIDQSGDKGQVFLAIPDTIAEGTEVTLSVAATAARSTAAKDFIVKLHAISDATEAATAVAAGLTSGLLDLSGTDSATSLTGSFTLPIAGSYGTEITWVSSDPAAITVDLITGKAKVLIPSTGASATPVTLTPTVKKKNGTATKAGNPITVTVPPITAQEAVDKDLIAITPDICTFGSASTDTPQSITGNFRLPTTGDRGTVLTWTSSDPAVASPNNTTGTVTVTPAVAETSVTLTALVSQPAAATQPTPGTATITVKVKAKGTIAATTYIVTFDSQSAGTAASPASASVTQPETTVKNLPTTPVKAGFTFAGWYSDTLGAGTSFTASTVVTASLTVYAKWEGPIVAYAGTGETGTINGPRLSATLSSPQYIAFDASSNIYFTEQNYCIRKIDALSGVVSLFAGSLQTYNKSSGDVDGAAASAWFYQPSCLAFGPDGTLYVADTGNHKIRAIAGGQVSTYAGINYTYPVVKPALDGPRLSAYFTTPVGLAFGLDGCLYVSDSGAYTIRKIDASGTVSTFAGTGTKGTSDGAAIQASFSKPGPMVADASGTLYVLDEGLIRKITSSGTVSTLAGGTTNAVQTYSGMNVQTDYPDGQGSAAGFYAPQGISIGSDGNLYVSDLTSSGSGSRIRKITPAGLVSTIVGPIRSLGPTVIETAPIQFPTDPILSHNGMNRPWGIAFLPGSMELFVADVYQYSNRIWKIRMPVQQPDLEDPHIQNRQAAGP
ncbi:MAG: immunoglobulin-like domain-containing protein [Rectinemataceae bacterium]